MKNIITMVSLTLLLAACGGGGDSDTETNTDTVISASPDDSTDTTPDDAVLENTADLEASADFDFSTSRSIAIDFDVEAARTSPGLMSVCSDYTVTGDVFDINYDSCTLQAPLVDGIYSGQMEVTNDITKVAGVVWFKDSTIPPVYKEFEVALGERLAGRGVNAQTLIWR